MRRQRSRRRPGFTLLEVLLVLVILVILASTSALFIRGAGKRARYNAAKAQIAAFETALDAYEMDHTAYPTSAEGLQVLRTPPSGTDPYLNKEIPLDPWGGQYMYESTGEAYRIWSAGQDRVEGTADDVSN